MPRSSTACSTAAGRSRPNWASGAGPRRSLGGAIRALLLASALVGAILLPWATGVDMAPALDQARGWSDVLWFTVKRSNDMQKLALVTALVILASVYGVSRTARS